MASDDINAGSDNGASGSEEPLSALLRKTTGMFYNIGSCFLIYFCILYEGT
jgi:hypothetical protein